MTAQALLDISLLIKTAKLGGTRKDAQIDCCAVFAAALYDVLTAQGLACELVCALKKCVGNSWAHSLVVVNGRYYDSLGEFSTDIYRQRARIHPNVELHIEYSPDIREGVYESEFDEMHAFYVKMLNKVLNPTPTRSRKAATTTLGVACA